MPQTQRSRGGPGRTGRLRRSAAAAPSRIAASGSRAARPGHADASPPPPAGASVPASASPCHSPSRQGLAAVAQAAQVQKGVGPVALHAHDIQIAPKIPRIRPRGGQPVPEAREGGVSADLRVGEVVLLLEGRARRGEEVAPDAAHVGPRDAAPLVGYFDHNILVLLAVGDDHAHGRHLRLGPVELAHGAEGVFDHLEEHVVEVGRDVAEGEVGAPFDLHLRRVPVLPGTHVARVLDGVSRNLKGGGVRVDEAHVVGLLWLPQLQVLANQDADADAADVEGVQELVHLGELPDLDRAGAPGRAAPVTLLERELELVHATRHPEQRRRVAVVDAAQDSLEGGLQLRGARRRVREELVEGLHVPVAHRAHGRHVAQAVWERFEL
mmetsp:Transcript_9439/g.31973  ORF Transcript_9439/g.31973 Transcript_9439/m.31973 type:complete len:382 (-) Transcript_9439:288-1433(-)